VSSSHIEFGNVDVSNQWDGVDVVKLKNSVMTLSGNQVSISSVANSYYRTCQLGELMHSIRLFYISNLKLVDFAVSYEGILGFLQIDTLYIKKKVKY